MLYIDIHARIHYPDKLCLWRDRDLNENPPIYSPNEVPHDYVFHYDTEEYDAYSLIVWPKGAYCVNQKAEKHFFAVETQSSIFELVNYIDFKPGFETTSELFDFWSARRRGIDYYLDIVVASVSDHFVGKYIEFIKAWIDKNGRIVSFEKPANVTSVNGHVAIEKITALTRKQIEVLERNELLKETDLFWDIDFPEFEGGGSSCSFLADWGPALISVLPTILLLLGIPNDESLRNNKEFKEIKKCEQAIIKKYKFPGLLVHDGYHGIDHRGNKYYDFHEEVNGSIVRYYTVKVKKKHVRKHYFVSIKKYD